MIKRTEKVHLSNTVKIMSAVVIAIVIVAGIGVPLQGLMNSRYDTERYISLGILLFIILIFVSVFIYAPKRISLSDEGLILYRGLGKVRLPYSEMADIRIYRPSDSVINIRTFGIGGVLGFIGRYYNKEIGHYISYVGDYSQAFLIQMKSGKKYVMSCNNAQEMVEEVRMQMNPAKL